MNYNIEDLFKNKMQIHSVTPPSKSWVRINRSLNSTIKYAFLFTFVGVALFFSIVLLTNKNQSFSEYQIPIKSDYKISDTKKIIENLIFNEDIQSSTSSSNNTINNIIIATTNTNNSIVQIDSALNSDDNHKNTLTDSIIDYQGFNLSATKGCSPLTIILENIEKSDNLIWEVDNETYKNSDKISVTLTEPDDYEIKLIRNDNGTINTYTKHVSVNSAPLADFSIKDQVVVNEEVVIENLSSNATKFYWYIDNILISSSENVIYNFHNSGNHKITLVIKNEFNCGDTISKYIEVIEPVQNIVCPNAFVPSIYGSTGGYYSDNSNEVFHPYVFGKDVTEYSLKIFNRKGKLLFQTTDFDQGWDGYYNNQLVPFDVYIFSIKGKFSDGSSFEEQGNVTVIINN